VKAKSWVRKPVDQFILAALEAKGIRPNESASRQKLIRPLNFDLIGLPTSPEEVKAFVSVRSANVSEQLVDRLLSSPHSGERWGGAGWTWFAIRQRQIRREPASPERLSLPHSVICGLNADLPHDVPGGATRRACLPIRDPRQGQHLLQTARHIGETNACCAPPDTSAGTQKRTRFARDS